MQVSRLILVNPLDSTGLVAGVGTYGTSDLGVPAEIQRIAVGLLTDGQDRRRAEPARLRTYDEWVDGSGGRASCNLHRRNSPLTPGSNHDLIRRKSFGDWHSELATNREPCFKHLSQPRGPAQIVRPSRRLTLGY